MNDSPTSPQPANAAAAPIEPRQNLLATFRALAAGHGDPHHVRLYTIVFTLLITAFFATLVSGLHSALRSRTAKNARAQREQVILRLMGVTAGKAETSARESARLFTTEIRRVTVTNPAGDKPYSYWRGKGSRSGRIVFPVHGKGFWGPVRGFIGADESTNRITGIAFVEHEETPGLGGRITEPWFCGQFVGKPMTADPGDGKFIRVVQGGTGDRLRELDAITGATGTSSAIEKMVNASIELYLRLTAKPKAKVDNHGSRIP